jgi:hypothetical protein
MGLSHKLIKNENDKATVYCFPCQKDQSITFLFKDFVHPKNKETIPHVLLGICDACQSVAVIPEQSMNKIRKGSSRFNKREIVPG